MTNACRVRYPTQPDNTRQDRRPLWACRAVRQDREKARQAADGAVVPRYAAGACGGNNQAPVENFSRGATPPPPCPPGGRVLPVPAG